MGARALTIPIDLAEGVLLGRPVLPLEALGPQASHVHPGHALSLLVRGGDPFAVGIGDPENGVVRVWGLDPDEPIDREFFRRRVAAALDLRRRLFSAKGTSAYRLIHGDGDRLSGFAVDAYGDYLVSYVYSKAIRSWADMLYEALMEVVKPRGIVEKLRAKVTREGGKVEQRVVAGDSPPEQLVVVENGVPYEVHLLGGLNVGLFTDMRELRVRLPNYAAGRVVLNTFAYSGSFSVVAARCGAREVVSVDLSSGALGWAKDNFRLSGVDPEKHRFYRSDVMGFLRRAPKGVYELIILDPPTFSQARKAVWSLRKDYPRLISRAIEALPDGGVLWVSTNMQSWPAEKLEVQIADAARALGRPVQVLEILGLPPDYPTPLAYPEGRYLKVYILQV